MLAHEERLDTDERDVLVGAALAARETLDRLVGGATRRVARLGHVRVSVDEAGAHLAAEEGAQFTRARLVRTVRLRQVDERGEQVELLAMTEAAVECREGRTRAREAHAAHANQLVVRRQVDRHAQRVAVVARTVHNSTVGFSAYKQKCEHKIFKKNQNIFIIFVFSYRHC